MNKLIIFISALMFGFAAIINLPTVFAASTIFEPFKINYSKTSAASSELNQYVEDSKIIDINFNEVNRIINQKSDYISLKIPYNNSELTVTLKRFDILTPNAKIVSGTNNGDVQISTPDFAAYTSDLYDKNSPLITVTFFKDNVSAIISNNQETIVLARRFKSEDYIMYQTSKLKIRNNFNCFTDEFDIPKKIYDIKKDLDPSTSSSAFGTLLKANIAVESDFEFYTFWGNSVSRATQYIISLYIPVSALYVRDINCQLLLTYIRVWSVIDDPYPDATSSSTLLNVFRSYWNANMSGVPRTIAHYVSTRPGGLGGIAFLNVLCSSLTSGNGYAFSDIDGNFNQIPTYSWDVMVVAHETGHNFGSLHTHNCSWPGGPIDSCYTVEGGCYTGPMIPRVGTIMSYCHLNATIALLFGPLPSQVIRNSAQVASCINTLSGYLVAYPNGGHIFRSGQIIPVMWGTSNTGNIDIQYTSNNGSTWNAIASNIDATLRTHNWTIPYISTTTNAKVRVFQSGNPGLGDESDSTFQIRPTLNPFTLVSPPQLFSTTVSTGDTSKIHFTFNRAGTLPEIKYKWFLSTVNNAFNYNSFTNNSGSDTVISVTRHILDSLVTAWGASNIGDSLRVRWTVRSYTVFDSLSSSSNFLITFLRTVIGIQPISSIIPDKYFIMPNYPNPFNPETKIKFGLPAASKVKITIFDMLGREVDVIVNSNLEAGEYLALWNASEFASGIYIYKIEANDFKGNKFTETKKMVLVK